jgi:RNA polymerase sigma-70 factor (ECF subfamily)
VHVVNGQAADETRLDITLLERIIARDESAVATLYDRHSRLLFGLILRILRDRGEAEETLQEVFLSVWSKAESYDAALGPPVAWLVRIARNRSIDRLRAKSVRARTLQPVDESPGNSVHEAPETDNPESSASRREERDSVLRALAALPCDQRELIEHAYFLGLTHSELASRFDLPLGTVKTRVRTGMHALRERLSSYA